MVDRQSAREALDVLRPGLSEDGFDLRLDETAAPDDPGVVHVVLEAKPDACLDCLVPDEMMVAMIESAISSRDSSLRRVVLTKQGFAPH